MHTVACTHTHTHTHANKQPSSPSRPRTVSTRKVRKCWNETANNAINTVDFGPWSATVAGSNDSPPRGSSLHLPALWEGGQVQARLCLLNHHISEAH